MSNKEQILVTSSSDRLLNALAEVEEPAEMGVSILPPGVNYVLRP